MKRLSLVLVLSGLILPSVTSAAHAEGFQVRKNALEKVDWYHGRRQLQYVNENPTFRDFTEEDESPMVEIQLPERKSKQGYTLVGPGGSSPDSSIPRGGLRFETTMKPTQQPSWMTTLPKSRFRQSNINPKSLVPKKALPAGYDTGIHGQLLTPIASTQPANAAQRLAHRGDYIKPPVKTYSTYNAIGTGNSGRTTKADCYGRIQRGDLLKN